MKCLKLEDVNRDDFLLFPEALHEIAQPFAIHKFQAVRIVADKFKCQKLMKQCKKFIAHYEADLLFEFKIFSSNLPRLFTLQT